MLFFPLRRPSLNVPQLTANSFSTSARNGSPRARVRAKISVEQRVKDSIHEDADFYVTTQGVLGEQYLAIDPGSHTIYQSYSAITTAAETACAPQLGEIGRAHV